MTVHSGIGVSRRQFVASGSLAVTAALLAPRRLFAQTDQT